MSNFASKILSRNIFWHLTKFVTRYTFSYHTETLYTNNYKILYSMHTSSDCNFSQIHYSVSILDQVSKNIVTYRILLILKKEVHAYYLTFLI